MSLPRPPIMLYVLAAAFLLLVASLVIGSFVTPAFPPYPLSAATSRPVGDSLVGPAVYTLDASAVDRWRGFRFADVAAVDAEPWDLAFRRNHVRTGAGVGIVDLGPVPFDAVRDAPTPAQGYVTGAIPGDSSNPAIGKWYDYSWISHLLTSRGHVYAVRTATDRYAKFEIVSYYCADVGAACYTIRYAYQGDGSRRLAEGLPTTAAGSP